MSLLWPWKSHAFSSSMSYCLQVGPVPLGRDWSYGGMKASWQDPPGPSRKLAAGRGETQNDKHRHACASGFN